MKRGRYDGQYDKVRRQAGYDLPRYEFPDERMSDEERRTARRVADLNEDFKARMAQLSEAELKRTEELAAKLRESSKRNSERIMRQEWSRAGLDPPNPLVSMALALNLGCWIEEVCGEKVLRGLPVKPTAGSGRKREDYGSVDGS